VIESGVEQEHEDRSGSIRRYLAIERLSLPTRKRIPFLHQLRSKAACPSLNSFLLTFSLLINFGNRIGKRRSELGLDEIEFASQFIYSIVANRTGGDMCGGGGEMEYVYASAKTVSLSPGDGVRCRRGLPVPAQHRSRSPAHSAPFTAGLSGSHQQMVAPPVLVVSPVGTVLDRTRHPYVFVKEK